MASLVGLHDDSDQPNKPLDPLPNGKYIAQIVESEMKSNSKNTGEYLSLDFQIVDGEHAGRHVYANLNLKNPNKETVRIARGDLAAIKIATGVLHPLDSVDLHNLPMLITVKCKPRTDTGELKNEIKGYEPKSALTGLPQQAPAKSTTPPWQRKVG